MYLLPLSLRHGAIPAESVGFTQDVSSRGVFFFTDAALEEGAKVELTFQMPSEVTLGESMRVRCQGRILRVVKPVAAGNSLASARAETKIGVAVRLECYDYLPDSSESASFPRVSTLHPHHEEEQPADHSSARSVLG